MNLGKKESLDVNMIVSDFSMLLNKRLQQFEQQINTDNKIGIKTMEVLSELPMVKELQRQVAEKDAEIARLQNELKNYRKTKKVTLQTNELLENDSKVSYDDISSLVSDEVNRLEAERRGVFVRDDYTKPACNLTGWSWQGSACSLPAKPCLGTTYNPYSFLNNDESDEDEEEEDEEDEDEEDEDEEDEDEDEEDEDEEDEDEDEEEDEEDEEDDKEAASGEASEPPSAADARDLKEGKAATGEESSDKEDEEEEEGLDVDEITIDGTIYYTNDRQNGTIFKRDSDGEVGDEIGHFEDGHAFFS